MAKIKIIQAPDLTHPFAVIYKESGLSSAPLKEGDESALTQAIKLFPELKTVKGKKEVECGLMHRIDKATSGLLLIASTQETYEALQTQQKNDEFVKYYRARVEGNTDIQKKVFDISSRFRAFGTKGREVRAVFDKSNISSQKKAGTKIYTTKIELDKNKAFCSLTQGYRHQVRVHLASCGFPIKGDPLYNPLTKDGDIFYFEAFKIEFTNPLTGERLVYECEDSFIL